MTASAKNIYILLNSIRGSVCPSTGTIWEWN